MPKDENLEAKLKRLRLFGCLARLDEVRKEPWLDRVLVDRDEEKTRRSLEHRMHIAGIGTFKPLADFDWKWPKKIDRAQIEELFTLDFIAEGANVVLLGPNGVGKTMLLRNIAHRALHDGRAVVVRSASDLLADLAKQESSVARARRLAAYVAAASALHRRGRLPLVRRAARRPALRGRHASLRQGQLDPAHDEQALRRVADDLPERGVRRHPRRPAPAPRRGRRHRRRELPAARGRGAPEAEGCRSKARQGRQGQLIAVPRSPMIAMRRRRPARSSVSARPTRDRSASSTTGALARDRSDSSHRCAQD